MRKFAVIGLGQYGCQVATSLADLGADVLAIDSDQAVCNSLKRVDGIQPVCLDATDEQALRATGIEEVDAAVVAIGQHLEVSIVVTALLRQVPVQRIVARSSSDLHGKILTLLGAAQVHNPEVEMAIRDAQAIFSPALRDRTALATGHHMVELDARESLWGKTLAELDFRTRFELTVIAIKKRVPIVDQLGETGFREEVNRLPTGSDVIEEGDIIVVIGTPSRAQEFLGLWS